MNRKKTPVAPKKRGRPPKVTCVALIPLNTTKIRKTFFQAYQRRKKVLEKLQNELQHCHEVDEPEFQKFLAHRFGAEQSQCRELCEQIRLCQSRQVKIHFLARMYNMSKERYYSRLAEQVTPEQDLWAVLEAELATYLEEERRQAEAAEAALFASEYLDFDEDGETGAEECGDEADDEDNSCDESFAGGEEYARGFSDLFNFGFGGFTAPDDTTAHDIKKLYRELCLRYHPDRIGAHDATMQRLWISIQEAYQEGDLTRLRSIQIGIKLEVGEVELGCSEINELTQELEWSIQEARKELFAKKQEPDWGFASWSDKKRQQAVRELRMVFEENLAQLEFQLHHLETEFERFERAYKTKQKKKSSAKKRKEK